eukprot:GHVN01038979.1.p1 GENE.GHVN01038979.1~~GHVN01038979.1.p1  ORF type:complete len:314 (-),score=121.00 GHVN01038979.1:129-1070(-)
MTDDSQSKRYSLLPHYDDDEVSEVAQTSEGNDFENERGKSRWKRQTIPRRGTSSRTPSSPHSLTPSTPQAVPTSSPGVGLEPHSLTSTSTPTTMPPPPPLKLSKRKTVRKTSEKRVKTSEVNDVGEGRGREVNEVRGVKVKEAIGDGIGSSLPGVEKGGGIKPQAPVESSQMAVSGESGESFKTPSSRNNQEKSESSVQDEDEASHVVVDDEFAQFLSEIKSIETNVVSEVIEATVVSEVRQDKGELTDEGLDEVKSSDVDTVTGTSGSLSAVSINASSSRLKPNMGETVIQAPPVYTRRDPETVILIPQLGR